MRAVSLWSLRTRLRWQWFNNGMGAAKKLIYFVIIPAMARCICEQHGNITTMTNNVIDLEKYKERKIEAEMVRLLRLLNWSGIHGLLDHLKDNVPLQARIIFLMAEYDIDPDQYEY
jgi:hypothetical protein